MNLQTCILVVWNFDVSESPAAVIFCHPPVLSYIFRSGHWLWTSQ